MTGDHADGDDDAAARYGAVDLGATNLRAAVGTAGGDLRAVERRRTPRGPDGGAVADAVVETLRAAAESARAAAGTTDAGTAGGAPGDRTADGAPDDTVGDGADEASGEDVYETTGEGADDTASDDGDDALAGDLRAVGVGSIGPLDAGAGTVTRPPNLPVDAVPLGDRLRAALGPATPVVVRNDAVAAVAGERRYAGAPDDAVYLTLSTGVGAGAAVDGHRLGGWGGNAAELGHVTVDPEGRMPCGCGGRGHWEAYCSGEAVPRYARYLYGHALRGTLDDAVPGADPLAFGGPDDADGPEPAGGDADAPPAVGGDVAGREGGTDGREGPASAPPTVDGDPRDTGLSLAPPDDGGHRPSMAALSDPGVTAAAVFDAADRDPLAALTVSLVGRHAAVGTAAAVHAYAPRLVSVGGAVALRNPDRVLGPVRRHLPALVATRVPELRVTPLGDDAVLYGALALAVEATGDGGNGGDD